jgi:predicted membrane protein (TIGR00267 family)
MFTRFIRSRVDPDDLKHHLDSDPHKRSSNLADIILGGQDGLVNVLGVILGVAAAAQETRLVLAAGLAATFAESVSMGAVAYTSRRAEQDYYQSELEREHRHITEIPNLEREEVREIYRRKGFEGKLLDQTVDTITANKDVWVAVMLAEEHRLMPPPEGHAVRSAFIVGIAALIGSLIPLLPFFFWTIGASIAVSMVISALTLFGVGVYKAKTMIGHPTKSGIEMAVIGIASALIGYAVGLLFAV